VITDDEDDHVNMEERGEERRNRREEKMKRIRKHSKKGYSFLLSHLPHTVPLSSYNSTSLSISAPLLYTLKPQAVILSLFSKDTFITLSKTSVLVSCGGSPFSHSLPIQSQSSFN
tara:strand:+ start:85 stop:429 length:345 start_codon:yes stop_codon:yes gene_type:complete